MSDQNKKQNKQSKILRFTIILAVLLAAEIGFDIFEITVGKIMLLTNSIRPKTGRLWEEEQKDQSGMMEVEKIEEQQTEENISVYRMDDLVAALSMRQSVTLSADEYKRFYRSLPVQQSRTFLDPLQFLKLARSSDWHAVHFSKSDGQLVSDFVDGYDNLLHETIVTLATLFPEQEQSPEKLEQIPEYEGRVLEAELFFKAFDQLPRSFQLQIVNDPYKLVQWGDNLTHVAISPFVSDQGVKILFKVGKKVYEMYASEIAVGYLIQRINQLKDAPQLKVPGENTYDQ